MPEVSIRPALPAQELAGPLIEAHHDHLADARILWLLTTQKRRKANRVVLGTAARLGVVARFLSSGLESIDTGYDFMILLSERQWGGLKPQQRLALVDHCLCRCGQRVTVNRRTGAETKTWCTLAPDVEEFSAVVERHGLWLNEQKAFVQRAGRQLPLEEPDTPPPGRKSRRTTVEPDGIVVKSEQIDETSDSLPWDEAPKDEVDAAEHARKNAETAARLEKGTADYSTNIPGSESTNGVDHAPGWQETTGIGASEHEQRRRRRGPRSSESVPGA